jgi:hypothetical protein
MPATMMASTLKLTFPAAPVAGELMLVVLGTLMVEVTLNGVIVGRVTTDGVTVGRRIIGGVTVVSIDEAGAVTVVSIDEAGGLTVVSVDKAGVLATTEEMVIQARLVVFGGNKVGGSVKFKNGEADSRMGPAEKVVDTNGWIVKPDPVGLQWQSVKSQSLTG